MTPFFSLNSFVNTISKGLLNKSFAARGLNLTTGGEGQRLIEKALTEKSGISEQVQLLLVGMLVGVGALGATDKLKRKRRHCPFLN